MSDTAKNQILEFVRGRYPQAEIDESQDIFSLGFVNSLFAMELVMYIEKTFGITIPNDELRIDNFRTANSMGELVTRLSSASPVQV
jgi:acyl carrier protein